MPENEAIPEQSIESPAGPPKGYENVPSELWPDKDGNPPRLTPELMHKLRGRYFTVRHIRLDCGHKLDQINQPRNNCHDCWAAFFTTHPQLVQVAHEFYSHYGQQPMIAMRGAKFVKMFEKFMAMMYEEMRRRKAEEEANVTSNQSGPDRSTGGDCLTGEAPTVNEVGQSGGNQVSDSPTGEAV